MLAADMDDEIRSTLIKGYSFLRKSQFTENPPGDYIKMFRDLSKGGWGFSDKDQGWSVSDCTSESLECCLIFESMPSEFIGEKMDMERLYDAVNMLLYLQSKNGGIAIWEAARGKKWLEWLSPIEFVEDTILEHEYLECTGSAIVVLARFMKQFSKAQNKRSRKLYNKGCLVAAGKTYHSSEPIRRAVQFLLKIQNVEGGWGESYLSCPNKKYIPLEGNKSNMVNTGQALMVLILSGQMERDPLLVSSCCESLNQFADG
ncbi:unnamed protein product [Arabidopsis arenosa]|uniref:Squalene cyclase C-terminal domain-containing protein n=1 Tax=Arabidopsis arenosa TaxID=38785 RepID=A0A8S2A2S0_ARAAE|nr:unnamed protein product [Arabidopsis arenosa]